MIKQYKQGNQVIWYDGSLIDQPSELLFDPSYWQQQQRVLGSAQGRGTTWFVDMGQCHAALRHYRRGGLFGKLVEDKYLFTGWDQTRAYQELMLLDQLKQAGVNVPKPIAAKVEKSGLTYTADLLIEKIADAQDLVAILKQGKLSEQAYYQIGEMIGKMHQQQVNHTDLNIHNILLDSDQAVWIIDFDKCRKEAGEHWKKKNLGRLKRSFAKECQRFAIHWSENDWLPLQQGYSDQF
ncbi:3-deoxy-D-manno-octulosonic acid kinase [Vibrio salilacus]|uniref:3-deoxy-D-manno-octulosonic acid kinase n=1 Tax=Vibrio salilacus TaxID=1323749 RepID=UPI000C295C54|nr:3-deoxy-D-manno-octulosonic acid kinase [Vibrio salilacus]